MAEREEEQADALALYWATLAHDATATPPEGLDPDLALVSQELQNLRGQPDPTFVFALRHTLVMQAEQRAEQTTQNEQGEDTMQTEDRVPVLPDAPSYDYIAFAEKQARRRRTDRLLSLAAALTLAFTGLIALGMTVLQHSVQNNQVAGTSVLVPQPPVLIGNPPTPAPPQTIGADLLYPGATTLASDVKHSVQDTADDENTVLKYYKENVVALGYAADTTNPCDPKNDCAPYTGFDSAFLTKEVNGEQLQITLLILGPAARKNPLIQKFVPIDSIKLAGPNDTLIVAFYSRGVAQTPEFKGNFVPTKPTP